MKYDKYHIFGLINLLLRSKYKSLQLFNSDIFILIK